MSGRCLDAFVSVREKGSDSIENRSIKRCLGGVWEVSGPQRSDSIENISIKSCLGGVWTPFSGKSVRQH